MLKPLTPVSPLRQTPLGLLVMPAMTLIQATEPELYDALVEPMEPGGEEYCAHYPWLHAPRRVVF